MTIHELIAKFPAESIVFQRVDQSVSSAQRAKDGSTRLTIHTNQISPTEVLQGTGKVGLLIWVPADQWASVVNSAKQESPK
jgi:hypothetical protein